MGRFLITDNPRAQEIQEELLHQTGKVFSTGDPEVGIEFFDLPFLVETSAGRSILETQDDLRQLLGNVLAYFHENDVTHVIRTCVSAEFLTPRTVGGTHVSRLMLKDGSLFRKPYPTFSILRQTREGWKVASSVHAILDSDAHNRALTAQPKQSDAIALRRSR